MIQHDLWRFDLLKFMRGMVLVEKGVFAKTLYDGVLNSICLHLKTLSVQGMTIFEIFYLI